MKYKYSVNNDNRLLVKSPKMKEAQEVDGKFNIDKDNRLIYALNEPAAWRRSYKLPPKIIFEGNWQLNKNYDLELILDKARKNFQDGTLVIKGSIISTDRDILAFLVKSYDRKGSLHVQILKLAVTWLNDETNRLSFIVKKSLPDTIVLEGNWRLNENQQIIYTYDKTDLKTKTKVSYSLTFAGYWKINQANKLAYILKHSLDSKFDFRAQLESPTIYPQEGEIKYRLGIGLSHQRPLKENIISLYGAWKFGRNLGLNFQMRYAKGEIQETEFAADVAFGGNNEVIFALRDKKGEPLGLNLIFTHKFLKKTDREAFLRLKKSYTEARMDLGVQVPF